MANNEVQKNKTGVMKNVYFYEIQLSFKFHQEPFFLNKIANIFSDKNG